MGFLVSESVTVTTDGAGAATAFTARHHNGLLHAIQYTKPGVNPFSDGVVITITAEVSGLAIWTETLSTNASKTRYPRDAAHKTDGTAALYAAGGTALVERIPLASERIKIVIASGGAAKLGTFRFIVADAPAKYASGAVA